MALKILIPVLLALVRPTVAQEKTATAARGTSGHLNLVPTLEEPPSSWLLQKDGFDTTLPLPTDVSDTNVQKRQSLPYVPDVLIVTLAALTLGVSFLLRELCRGGHDQKEQKKLVVKPSEATDAFGCTELHVAASEGSALAVRKLLEGGSDPNAREAWEETPLHMAARSGNVQVAQLLVSHGAEVNARNLDDLTPLVLAAQEGKEEVCSFLLDAGAGAGGMEEEKLPCLLNSLLLLRMLAPEKTKES